MMKRILSTFLVAILLVSLLPIQAIAEETATKPDDVASQETAGDDLPDDGLDSFASETPAEGDRSPDDGDEAKTEAASENAGGRDSVVGRRFFARRRCGAGEGC